MYASHRKAVCKRLNHGLIAGLGNQELVRNNDVYFPFRQDSNFLYLTGINEMSHAFILTPADNKYILFIPKVDAKHVVWLGSVLSIAETKKKYGADQVFYLTEFEDQLQKYAKKFKNIFFLNTNHSKGAKLKRQFKVSSQNEQTLLHALRECRIQKTPAELKLMQRAADISSRGHIQAMKTCRSGMWEFQVQSHLEQVFLNEGAKDVAYGSIVAGGKNAAVLHYYQNEARLRARDLLLIDAGAEVQGYAADITRTFPVGGKFTAQQRDVYQATLNAQLATIKAVKSGVSFKRLHLIAASKIVEGLKEMGLLKGSLSAMVQQGVDRLFFPHGIGHFLGLDVHDVGRYSSGEKEKSGILRANRKLEKNHVITVEPGIYFIPVLLEDAANRKKFKDFVNWKKVDRFLNFGGVRIEDDVLVTQTGSKVLTAKCPKKINDLEPLIGST